MREFDFIILSILSLQLTTSLFLIREQNYIQFSRVQNEGGLIVLLRRGASSMLVTMDV